MIQFHNADGKEEGVGSQKKVFSWFQEVEQQPIILGEGKHHQFIDTNVVLDPEDITPAMVKCVHGPVIKRFWLMESVVM